MKKYLIILLFLVLLTGCDAVYKLEIRNKDFKEKIIIETDKKKQLNYFKNNQLYAIMDGASNFEPYKMSINTWFSNKKLKLKYKYNDLEYEKATVLSTCFDAYNVIKEENYYLLSTSKGVKCFAEEYKPLLKNLKIVIQTNHKVIDSNADEYGRDTYTWYVDKNNYKRKNIYLKFEQNKYIFNYKNEFVISVVILLAMASSIGLIILILKNKSKRANNI